MRVSFEDQMKDLRFKHTRLFEDLCDLTTLEDVFEWVRSVTFAGQIDLIAQDEFSHDMIIHLTDTNEYLVFGST